MTPLELFFGRTIFFWLVLIFAGTFLTMRLISEERRAGTIEMLLTSPVSETQVVPASTSAPRLLPLPLAADAGLRARSCAGTPVDWGPVAASYLGIFGIGALFLAVGLFASALTRNQMVAAVLAFALTFLCFLPACSRTWSTTPRCATCSAT